MARGMGGDEFKKQINQKNPKTKNQKQKQTSPRIPI